MHEKDFDFQLMVQQLHIQLGEQQLYDRISSQLTKDFQRSGINDFTLKSNTPADWNEEVQQTLKKITAIELQQLLYAVDIPESILPQIQESEQPLFYLSNSILQRELLKIYFQEKFK